MLRHKELHEINITDEQHRVLGKLGVWTTCTGRVSVSVIFRNKPFG